MPETEPKTYQITVKLSETGTIVDPQSGKRHEPQSEVVIPADEYGNPLSRHWRRRILAGDCKRIDEPEHVSADGAIPGPRYRRR